MKKYLLLIISIVMLLSSCKERNVEICRHDVQSYFSNRLEELLEKGNALSKASIEKFYATLSDEQKVGQLFLVSLDGHESSKVPAILSTNRIVPGGYLLFGFNISETADETIDFLTALNNAFLDENSIPPFFSIDHEGGIVNRLRSVCSRLPSQQSVAQKFTPKEAERLYELHGIQLKNLGIQINLAPVVEVLTDENILFLEDRSFGSLYDVINYSKAEISGMRKAGVLPVLKHFPGNTNNDPHTGLPVLNCALNELNTVFIEPFTQLHDGKPTGVLVAHTVVPSIDDKPACLSEKVIELLYPESERYDGLLFSDDLLMKALIKNGYPVEKSLIAAINAGINILMISTGSFDEYAAIVLEEYDSNQQFRMKVDESVKKILEWKLSCNLLKKNVTQTGWFSYDEDIMLPEKESDERISLRKKLFRDAYSEAGKLYNDIWWSR